MIDPAVRQIYRSRWDAERQKMGFLDIQKEEFAKEGIARHLPSLTVRVVILPGDPLNEFIEFDHTFWSWWKTDQQPPFDALPEEWGPIIPTTSAAVRRRSFSDDPWKWDSYIALYRHGGLDMGLGRDGAAPLDDNRRIFLLLRIIGCVWTVFHFYRECIDRFKINGPWECSIVLLGTKNGMLGGFGSGWAPYNDPYANPIPCPDQNLWWRRELDEWPSADGIRDLAFGVGGWIEESWGMRLCRFLAHNGPLAGKFDAISYRNNYR
jgi:hypothetical protein